MQDWPGQTSPLPRKAQPVSGAGDELPCQFLPVCCNMAAAWGKGAGFQQGRVCGKAHTDGLEGSLLDDPAGQCAAWREPGLLLWREGTQGRGMFCDSFGVQPKQGTGAIPPPQGAKSGLTTVAEVHQPARHYRATTGIAAQRCNTIPKPTQGVQQQETSQQTRGKGRQPRPGQRKFFQVSPLAVCKAGAEMCRPTLAKGEQVGIRQTGQRSGQDQHIFFYPLSGRV